MNINIRTQYLRPVKAKRLHKISDNYLDRSGTLSLTHLKHILVTPLGQLPGASENPNSSYIIDDCDFCSKVEDNIIVNSNESTHLGGKVLYGGFLRTQWGHFLMNSTSRLWPLFNENKEDYDYILFFSDTLSPLSLQRNFKEFFALAGIEMKIIIAHKPVSIENLVIPESSFEHTNYYSNEAALIFDVIKSKIEPAKNGPDKIFLTRSSLPSAAKGDINCKQIDKLFKDNGYTIVSPEKISLSTLISLIIKAKHIASISGSVAHNFVFANEYSKYVIIERTPVNNAFQIGINMIKNFDLTLIDAYQLPTIALSTGNCFLYEETDCLRRFIADNGWHKSSFKTSMKAKRSELRKFLKANWKQSGYGIGVEPWMIDDMAAIGEAYIEAYEYYKPWLDRRKPLFFKDYFSTRCVMRMLKDFIKRRLQTI